MAMNAVAARPGGGLSYLLSQIPHLDGCVDLRVFAGPSVAPTLSEAFRRLSVEQLPRWAAPLPLRLLWEHIVFPYLARDADVLYSIGTFASLTRRKPQVVVVLIPYVFGPEGRQVIAHTKAPLPFRARISLQRLLGRLTISRATVLIATSEFTASQIRSSTRNGGNVRVVPIAGADVPANESSRAEGQPFEFSRPYALSVGGDPPHKDQLGLIQSWPVNSGLDLVLAGNSHSVRSSKVDAAVRKRDDVHWLGPIDGYGRLFQLYREAEVVVCHSLLEGFGMTPLEAMAQGTPVVASDIPAHREVCGDAALYYDPFDRSQLFPVIQEILTKPDLAEQLVAAGKERLTLFSWADNGEAMCGVFHEVGRQNNLARHEGDAGGVI